MRRSYHIFVLDRQQGEKLLDLDFNGRLTEVQVSMLAMVCSKKRSTITDLLFLREVQDRRLSEQLANMDTVMVAAKKDQEASVKLTRREAQVLKGILHHQANKEIAYDLNIAERTVKYHVGTLLQKFQVTTREEVKRVQDVKYYVRD